MAPWLSGNAPVSYTGGPSSNPTGAFHSKQPREHGFWVERDYLASKYKEFPISNTITGR